MTTEKLFDTEPEILLVLVFLMAMMSIICCVYEVIYNLNKKVKTKNNKDQGKVRVPFDYGKNKEQAEYDAKNDTYNNSYKNVVNDQKRADFYDQ